MKKGLLLFLCMTTCTSEHTDIKPVQATKATPSPIVDNVVFITIDTLRADYVGALGGKTNTPVMDALAEKGWVFDQCFSASMLTNPSHASMMTSLYPRDHGVYDNESGIPDGTRTIAWSLERLGLRTASVIGFPHLNPSVSNLGIGFQRVHRATRQEKRAHETSVQALQLLDEFGPKERFFLWVHYTDPHAPYEPENPPDIENIKKGRSIKYAKRVAPSFQRNQPWFRKAFRDVKTVEQMIALYVAEIEATDRGLGILLDGLQERNRLKNTAIVLTSDHGENLGEHGLYFHHGGLFAETVHVPLIISVPETAPRRVSGLVETVDIAPTVLEMLGAPLWQPMRGQSLMASALEQKPIDRQYAFSEHMLKQLVSVRSTHGTLILHQQDSRQFPNYPFILHKKEAYDRASDPAEETPLPLGHPLAALLDVALQGYLDMGLQWVARTSDEQDKESLKALGYLD